GPGEVGATEVGPSEVGPGEVGPGEAGAVEVGPAEVAPLRSVLPRLAPLRSGLISLLCSRHVFHTSTPCLRIWSCSGLSIAHVSLCYPSQQWDSSMSTRVSDYHPAW